MTTHNNISWIKPIAKFGLAAKGVVYCLIGSLAIMSAFHLGGQTSGKSDKEGVFKFILEQPGGKALLLVIAIGLFSYAVWRFLQSFIDTENKGNKAKGLAKRFTYFFSGVTYVAFAWISLKFTMGNKLSGGSSRQDMISELLQKPAGQWLVGIVAAALAGIGIYQIWYGNSEKYRKHVNLQELNHDAARAMSRAGKVGYISRGIVWLILAFLCLKAAINSKASEAGGTGAAFAFVEQSTFGTYLLAALGLGLICYGVLNFIRAAYEKFGH